MRSLVHLAGRLARANRVRYALLSVVVALGLTTFVLMNEMSNASMEGLDSALEEEHGRYGTFRVGARLTATTLPDDFTERTGSRLAEVSVGAPTWVRVVDADLTSCSASSSEVTRGTRVAFVTDLQGRQQPLAFGNAGASYCLAGQRIDAALVYDPDETEEREWQASTVLDARYLELAQLSSARPVTHELVVRTADPDGFESRAVAALRAEYREDAARLGVDEMLLFSVFRIDDGDAMFAAARGVSLVYEVIGWAVVALAGVSLLVAQILTERARSWFYGLGIALGSSRPRIAAYVLVDSLVVVLGGVLLAIGVLLALDPFAAEFVRNAFQIELRLVTVGGLAEVVTAAAVITLVGAAVPAVRAARRDPLDTLEPSG